MAYNEAKYFKRFEPDEAVAFLRNSVLEAAREEKEEIKVSLRMMSAIASYIEDLNQRFELCQDDDSLTGGD
jgi:hypothetical protein